MKRFYLLLSLISLIAQLAGAKTIHLETNSPEATWLNYQQGYSTTPFYWKGETSMDITLPSDTKGLNVNVNQSHVVNKITINGNLYYNPGTTNPRVTSSAFLSQDELPDGCTVYIDADEYAKKTVTIVADPKELLVKYNYREYADSDWKNGELTIVTEGVTNVITLTSRTGYRMTSIMFRGHEELGESKASYTLNPVGLPSGDNRFIVTSRNLNESRTSALTVDVTGDNEMVYVSRAGDRPDPFVAPDDDTCSGFWDPVRPSDYSVVLTGADLEKPIYFSDEFDLPIIVEHRFYENNLYKVSFLGKDVEPTTGKKYYLYDVEDGDVVKVEVDYPDVQIPVKINFVNPHTENAILNVMDTFNRIIPRDEWSADAWSVPMGTIVRINANSDDFNVSSRINGGEYTPGGVVFTALDENGYTVDIEAVPYDAFKVEVYYEFNPAHFRIDIGANGDNIVDMNADETMTVIYVPRSHNRIRILPEEGWIVTEVFAGAEAVGKDVLISSDIDVNVFVKENVRDLESIVYVDPSVDWSYSGMTLSQDDYSRREDLKLQGGYNTVLYNEADYPLYFSFVGSDIEDCVAYVNGERNDEALTMLEELPAGSVVKVYGSQPESYVVKLSNEEELPIEVVMDMIVPVEEPVEETVLRGTAFRITPAAPDGVVVSVNGVEQARPDGDVYTVNVDEDTEIAVKSGIPSGVAVVEASASGVDVFSLQGIRVLRGATPAQLRSLPSGLYIVAGRKVLINE